MTNVWIIVDLRPPQADRDQTNQAWAEFDLPETVDAIASALGQQGYTTAVIGNHASFVREIARDRTLPDLVFNISEGSEGRSREAHVPALCEAYRIPYTFSDPTTMAICQDKSVTSAILRQADLRVPTGVVARRGWPLADFGGLTYPVIVKPASQGTSIGITDASITWQPSDVPALVLEVHKRFSDDAVVEQFIDGDEFTAAVVGPSHAPRLLGISKILMTDPSVKTYGFWEKEFCEERVIYEPLPKSSEVHQVIEEAALAAYSVLGCRDAGRLDFRMGPEVQPFCLDANPLPGLHPKHSDLPIIAAQQGIPYRRLIQDIASAASQRY